MKTIRLEEICFHKFTLLGVSSIQTITIDFKHKFHWLLGSNGSGKSSLIREATPLVPDMKNYAVGGYRLQLWSVNDKKYQLKSTRGEKHNTHSFCEIRADGSLDELNYGYTQTVYNSLVDTIFGISKESHAVATGALKLTDMSAAERKAIFTSLSANDYTYALAYYKRLWSSFRDRQGSLRVDKERLVELRASNVNGDEEKTCIEEIGKLKSDIEGLMKMRPNVSATADVVQSAIKRIESEIRVLYNRMTEHSTNNKIHYPLKPIEELNKDFGRLEAQHAHNEAKIDETYRKYTELTRKREELLKTSGNNRQQLIDRRDEIMGKLGDYEWKSLSATADFTEIARIINQVQLDFQTVSELMVVNVNPDKDLDIEREKLVVLQQEAANLQLQFRGINTRIEEIQNHQHDPDVECPKCQFKFNPIYSSEKLQVLERDRTQVTWHIDKQSERVTKQAKLVEEMNVFHRGFMAWYGLVRKYQVLNVLWSKIMTEEMHTKDPHAIGLMLQNVHMDLQVAYERDKITKELKEINNTLAINDSVSEDRLTKMEEEIGSLQEALNGAYEKRSKDLDVLSQAKQKVALSNFIRSHAEKAMEYQSLLTKHVQDMYDIMEHDALNVFIRDLNVEISKRELVLRTMATKNAEIIRLENNIRNTEVAVEGLKGALIALSPKEGLIAKGMTGFINHFNTLMNDLIARIVTYEMKIPMLVPTDEKFELDYSIPIHIRTSNGSVMEVSDIKECSLGQKEIIELAWRILYLKFKGLDATPLPLDEFGNNLDVVHKHKVFEAVRHILSITNFTQVFMVSHMANTYGLMDGAGVTVLCPANIVIPDGVGINETTKIVRC